MAIAAAAASAEEFEALGGGSGGDNLVTTIIFSLAIIALLVVTLGVRQCISDCWHDVFVVPGVEASNQGRDVLLCLH